MEENVVLFDSSYRNQRHLREALNDYVPLLDAIQRVIDYQDDQSITEEKQAALSFGKKILHHSATIHSFFTKGTV